MAVLSACARIQKRALDVLKLEFQTVMSHHGVPGDSHQTSVKPSPRLLSPKLIYSQVRLECTLFREVLFSLMSQHEAMG